MNDSTAFPPKRERAAVEQARIDIPVQLLGDELDALATVVENYYGKLIQAGIPKELADRLLQDFHSWMLSHHRLTNEKDPKAAATTP